MNKEKVLGIVRHTLTFIGGILVMQGVIDDALFTELFGAAMTLAGGIWSVLSKNTPTA